MYRWIEAAIAFSKIKLDETKRIAVKASLTILSSAVSFTDAVCEEEGRCWEDDD